MHQKYRELSGSPLVRYVLVGGSAYVIELIIIVVAQKQGANSIFAVALSFWVGLIYTFVLQKFFSFRDKRTHHKVLLPQILTVVALVAFNFSFTIFLTALLQHVLPVVVTRTIAVGITTMWNFYLYRTRVFNTPVVD